MSIPKTTSVPVRNIVGNLSTIDWTRVDEKKYPFEPVEVAVCEPMALAHVELRDVRMVNEDHNIYIQGSYLYYLIDVLAIRGSRIQVLDDLDSDTAVALAELQAKMVSLSHSSRDTVNFQLVKKFQVAGTFPGVVIGSADHREFAEQNGFVGIFKDGNGHWGGMGFSPLLCQDYLRSGKLVVPKAMVESIADYGYPFSLYMKHKELDATGADYLFHAFIFSVKDVKALDQTWAVSEMCVLGSFFPVTFFRFCSSPVNLEKRERSFLKSVCGSLLTKAVYEEIVSRGPACHRAEQTYFEGKDFAGRSLVDHCLSLFSLMAQHSQCHLPPNTVHVGEAVGLVNYLMVTGDMQGFKTAMCSFVAKKNKLAGCYKYKPSKSRNFIPAYDLLAEGQWQVDVNYYGFQRNKPMESRGRDGGQTKDLYAKIPAKMTEQLAPPKLDPPPQTRRARSRSRGRQNGRRNATESQRETKTTPKKEVQESTAGGITIGGKKFSEKEFSERFLRSFLGPDL